MSIGIGLRFEVLKMALKHVKPDDAIAAAKDYLEFVVNGPEAGIPAPPQFLRADNMEELLELLADEAPSNKKAN